MKPLWGVLRGRKERQAGCWGRVSRSCAPAPTPVGVGDVSTGLGARWGLLTRVPPLPSCPPKARLLSAARGSLRGGRVGPGCAQPCAPAGAGFVPAWGSLGLLEQGLAEARPGGHSRCPVRGWARRAPRRGGGSVPELLTRGKDAVGKETKKLSGLRPAPGRSRVRIGYRGVPAVSPPTLGTPPRPPGTPGAAI